MEREKFYTLLNKVFDLMLNNKLREDMDDTLLEKLLSFLQSHSDFQINGHRTFSGELDFITSIIQNTDGLKLIDRAVSCLRERNDLLTSVIVFSLRFMGLIFKMEVVFVPHKSSLYVCEFASVLRSNILNNCAPSIQDAALSCLLSIAYHVEGALWIIEKGLLEFVFSCFSCSSYYVRKSAVNLCSVILPLWTSVTFSPSTVEQNVLINAVKDITSQIVTGAQLSDNHLLQATVSECCILTLKQCLESENIRTLILTHFHVIDEILNYFKKSRKEEISDNVLSLLLALYSCDNKIESVVKEVVEIMVAYEMFVPSLQLASSYIKLSQKPLLENHLHFIMMPLNICSGNISFNHKEEVFDMMSPAIYNSLLQKLDDKSICIKLISSCLINLSNLVIFMTSQTLCYVISAIEIAVKGPSTEKHLPMAAVCLGNRSICLSLLELFASLLSDAVYPILPHEAQVRLVEYLMCIISRPSSDSNILSEVIRLLTCLIQLNDKHCIVLPDDIKDELAKCLCRKLLDNKEPVVDNALHLGRQILTAKDDAWPQAVFKNAVHLIIWEIAVDGCHEGFIKASALKAVIDACLIACYFDDIKSAKSVDEVDIMKILCDYFHDPDFFVQRESVLCIHKWLISKEKILPTSIKDTVFMVLSYAVKSLDLELKLVALDAWQWCIESSSYFPLTSECNITKYVEYLCASGFGLSMLSAIEDYDEAVKFKAANILLNFRKKFIDLGFTYLSITIQEPEIINSTEMLKDLHVETISKEERIIGLNNVMNLSTSQQLSDICRASSLADNCNLKNNSFFSSELEPVMCPMHSFWSCIWSEKLDNLLSADVPSCSKFSEDCISLLEDIIAAEGVLVCRPVDETRDCY